MKEFKFTIDGNLFETSVNEIEDNVVEVVVNGTPFNVVIEKEEKNPAVVSARRFQEAAGSTAAPAAGILLSVKSPLPGSIMKVMVSVGQKVKKNDVLLTMESMKMENNVLAEVDGVIKAIYVESGRNVMQEEKLIDMETVVGVSSTAPVEPAAPKAAPVAAAAPAAPKAEAPKPAAAPAAPVTGGKKIVSPLPGSVVKVLVSEGQNVKEGQALVTLESMKMENSIMADCSGVVSKIMVTPGQTVMQDDVLVVIA